MNVRQMQYAILLSKTGSFSQAAQELSISQPAFSKQILTLEEELGVKLFERGSTPVRVTAAGAYFVREAEGLLYKENQLHRSMEKFRSGEAGQLVIGITPFRSSYMLSGVLRKLRKRFPHIQIKLHEAGSEALRKGAAEGKFDFAIVNLPVDDSVLDVRPLEPDKLVLAIPENLLSILDGSEIDFNSCGDLPFVVVGQGQEMRQLFDSLCARAGFVPNVVAEVVGLTTAWAVVRSGIAATILPWQFVEQGYDEHKIRVVSIKDALYFRRPAVVTKRGQYINEAAAYAIELLTGSNGRL
ncbi:MAG: LysR family transcriptional regulator [Ruminococcaceae bacterium]|nr:LysR family transcriptional regulator [Oscillospiraceae bacterium]